MSESANPDTVYTLQLLSAYTSELDSLPIELSRNFADLRELDAVLSSSITSLITKIQNLTKLIQDQASPETAYSSTAADRFWLLTDIAAETQRLKLGNEDKIRVSSQAADSLATHSAYMTALLSRIPDYDLSLLQRRTTYPHVAAFVPMMMSEGGRRRRGALGSSLLDVDRSPRKERMADTSRARNGTRRRNASPAESLLSVTSYPAPISQSNSRPGVQNGPSAPKPVNGTSKRSRNQNSPPPTFDFNAYDDDNWVEPNNGANLADISLVSSTNTNQAGDGGDDADGDDGRTYCFCNGPSYGKMIGCDGDDCEGEWFHLVCVGLTECPQGSWYCEKCIAKRAKRAGRGGKRRGAGARGAKSRGDD